MGCSCVILVFLTRCGGSVVMVPHRSLLPLDHTHSTPFCLNIQSHLNQSSLSITHPFSLLSQSFAALAHERRRINAEREAVALRSMIAAMVASSSSGRTHAQTTPRHKLSAEDGGGATPRSAALSPRGEEVCVKNS